MNVPPRPRGIGPMISGGPPRYTTADQAARLQGAHMEQEEKSRKARAPTDLNLPDGIEETVLGHGVQQYKTLQEFERKLDATMTRMRSQIQDYLFHRPKYYRTLRIFIWNTVQNQPWQEDDHEANKYGFDASQPTYKVFINGRLLPDDEPIEGNDDDNSGFESDTAMDTDEQAKARAERQAAAEEKAAKERTKPSPVHSRKSRMSHFFKAVTVDTHRDSNDQRQGNDAPSILEWKKPPPQPNAQTLADNADFDILSFERRSDGNTNCTFSFYHDDDPERFQLSPELASICDEKVEDRNTVLWKVWEYVKAYGLLQDEEKKVVSCDELLRSAFKCDTMTYPQLSSIIQNHMFALPPVTCPYTIRLDPEYASIPKPGNCSIYDIRVCCPPPTPKMPYFHGPLAIQTLKEIRAYNEQIALLVQKMQASLAKQKFLQNFSVDPATFMKKWMASQRRDMETILGEKWGGEEGGTMGGTEFRRGGTDGVWGSDKVREAVGLMVAKEGKRP